MKLLNSAKKPLILFNLLAECIYHDIKIDYLCFSFQKDFILTQQKQKLLFGVQML